MSRARKTESHGAGSLDFDGDFGSSSMISSMRSRQFVQIANWGHAIIAPDPGTLSPQKLHRPKPWSCPSTSRRLPGGASTRRSALRRAQCSQIPTLGPETMRRRGGSDLSPQMLQARAVMALSVTPSALANCSHHSHWSYTTPTTSGLTRLSNTKVALQVCRQLPPPSGSSMLPTWGSRASCGNLAASSSSRQLK